jgi:hypothetical protein
MSPEIKLAPLAYIDIVRHIQRFNHENVPVEQQQTLYGLVAGRVVNGNPTITKYFPLLHINKDSVLDFESHHEFFKFSDKFNADHFNPKFTSDEILGWVRTFPAENFGLGNQDKKNMLYFQTAYNENAIFIALDHTGDQYQMQMKHFKGPLPELDETTEIEDISWNFGEIDDIDDLFSTVLQIQSSRDQKAQLIKEVNEK